LGSKAPVLGNFKKYIYMLKNSENSQEYIGGLTINMPMFMKKAPVCKIHNKKNQNVVM
jgi:hypothetical protein